MNRKKKINAILKKRLKLHRAKLNQAVKVRYVPKAERAALEASQQENQDAAES